MIQPGLVLSAAAGAVAASVFAYVGHRQRGRSLARGMRVAGGAFATWWWGMSAYAMLVGVVLNALGAVGFAPVELVVALRALATASLCVAVGGLVAYVAFLYRGGRRTMLVGVLAGSVVYALLFALLAGHRAVAADQGAYEVTVVFEPALGPAKMALVLGLVALPQVLAALGLLALYPRVEGPTARWRILLVGGGILLWATSALLAALSGNDVAILLTRPLLGAAAALGSLWAYDPPAWARERFGVTAL